MSNLSYAQMAQNGSANQGNGGVSAAAAFATSAAKAHTVTALSRWSILDRQLPDQDKIKAIHVYDFDNTLFKTPLPNSKLWHGSTIGTLSSADIFVNGGWWHNSRILAATGEGIAKEEPRAWEGWWNEKIVELVRLSAKQKDALCVLLTGRSETGFSDLIKRIIASRGLEFDLASLKPVSGPSGQHFASTMLFKQQFLTAVMETYKDAKEITIYEDRPKHVKGFRDFMTGYNNRQRGGAATRGTIAAEVVPVADIATSLDPVVEVAEVQHLVNSHNESLVKRAHGMRGEKLIIKKTVFFTGYMVNEADTKRLLSLVELPPENSDVDLKILANNILICPRPCPQGILEKVGGMGSKMSWAVTGTACHEGNIWAVCLKPVPETAKFHTDNRTPMVVLALKRGVRPLEATKIQNWQPLSPDQSFTFETTVGEKVLLRIEPDDPDEDEYESLFPTRAAKRRHLRTEDANGRSGAPPQSRGFHQGSRGGPSGGRGGRNHNATRGFSTGPRGRGGRGRGGKPKHNYHSLDDVGNQNSATAPQPVFYDDTSYQPPATAPKGPQGYNNNNHNYNHNNAWQGQAHQGRSLGGNSSNNPADIHNYY